MAKMSTLNHLAVGSFPWAPGEEARIERNTFVANGETFEALRFCKNREGRHNRVHLVIREPDFVELFRDAVEKGVFHEGTLEGLAGVLDLWRQRRGRAQGPPGSDPFLEVIGLFEDGTLTEGIDDELYGDSSS